MKRKSLSVDAANAFVGRTDMRVEKHHAARKCFRDECRVSALPVPGIYENIRGFVGFGFIEFSPLFPTREGGQGTGYDVGVRLADNLIPLPW